MSETQWDAKLKSFLKKTGDDFKRAGAEMKIEAERLIAEAKDPERARKIKEGLNEVGTWAKKTAEELAGYVETGVKKAEVVLKDVVAKPVGAAPSAADQAKTQPSQKESVAQAETASTEEPPGKRKAVKKTVGGGAKKTAAGSKAAAKKPLGRAKR